MPTPPYICNVCNAMLESLEQLLSHIETHHPQKIRLTCESCGKVFSAPEYLTQHKKLHTRADRFKCEICGKFFARKDYLTDHTRRKHTKEKPFKCEICKKTFAQQVNLTVHTRTHTGVKPFKCEICGKFFTQKVNLTAHTRKHTEKTPFKSETFDQQNYLDQYNLLIHNTKEELICLICGIKIKASDKFNHFMSHSKENPQEDIDVYFKSFDINKNIPEVLSLNTDKPMYFYQEARTKYVNFFKEKMSRLNENSLYVYFNNTVLLAYFSEDIDSFLKLSRKEQEVYPLSLVSLKKATFPHILEGQRMLVAKKYISKGTLIGAYSGRVMYTGDKNSDLEREEYVNNPQNKIFDYTFQYIMKGLWVSVASTVNTNYPMPILAFVNHYKNIGSVNCYAETLGLGKNTPQILFFAEKNIEKNEELLIDYGKDYDWDAAKKGYSVFTNVSKNPLLSIDSCHLYSASGEIVTEKLPNNLSPVGSYLQHI